MFSNDPPSLMEQGTWLEAESMCYPSGALSAGRRARALCEDGVARVFRVGIPDTYFTIPAAGKVKGRSVTGYVSVDEGVLRFKETRR
jgi:hypothetical protein